MIAGFLSNLRLNGMLRDFGIGLDKLIDLVYTFAKEKFGGVLHYFR